MVFLTHSFPFSNLRTIVPVCRNKAIKNKINVSSMFADKPDGVSLVANATENTNCSDMMWVNLTCQASDANPPVESYQLLKNGEILATSNNGTWIRKVSEAGKHVYSCRALHIIGNVTSSGDVTISFNGGSNIRDYLFKSINDTASREKRCLIPYFNKQ